MLKLQSIGLTVTLILSLVAGFWASGLSGTAAADEANNLDELSKDETVTAPTTAPVWVEMGRDEDGAMMFVDSNSIYRGTGEYAGFVEFGSRLELPSEQMMTLVYVSAECATNTYGIIVQDFYDLASGDRLESHQYSLETMPFQTADAESFIGRSIQYVCGDR